MTVHFDAQIHNNWPRLLGNANAVVPRISPHQAREMMEREAVVVVDVRDGADIALTGTIGDAISVSLLDLEGRTDRNSPTYDERFDRDTAVILYCADGTHAAVGGKLLKELGFRHVFNLGAFKDWLESRETPALNAISLVARP